LSSSVNMFVICGRPGAGKSTLATQLQLQQPQQEAFPLHFIDLDVCITDEMKENFAMGQYPTLEQRASFMQACIAYTRAQLADSSRTSQWAMCSSPNYYETPNKFTSFND
jgi:CO dehydrogenase nickel-insertion accessory protein CooC1